MPEDTLTIDLESLLSCMGDDAAKLRDENPDDEIADTLDLAAEVLGVAGPDSARLRWLTEDHADSATRARCEELLGRIPMMSYSAVTADVDAAMRECAAVGAA